jgi:ornithine cyclodeaminase/alanine dehydrogenase-like protein (mu-crystallin family)
MNFYILNEREVRINLPMTQCIDLMIDTMVSLANGQINIPHRMIIPLHEKRNYLYAISGMVKNTSTFWGKDY